MARAFGLSFVAVAATLIASCGAQSPSLAPTLPAADAETAAVQCRQIAYDRVRNTPAVRSGRASGTQEGPRPYYESCMTARGFKSFPPY